MADVKKRMAHVRAKYFYREKRGPAAARFLVQWLRETGGEKAVCRFESQGRSDNDYPPEAGKYPYRARQGQGSARMRQNIFRC